MTEAERLADRIIILDHGEIVADGTTSELTTKEGGKGIRFGAPAGLDTIALGAALMATVDEEQPGEYLVHADPKPATIAAITAWLAEKDLALSDLRAGRERLEDVFLRLTGRPESTNGTVARDPAPPEDEIRVEPAAGRRRRRVADGGRGPGATEPQE
jgi:ABC-2 type transport system ATP-binding protein